MKRPRPFDIRCPYCHQLLPAAFDPAALHRKILTAPVARVASLTAREVEIATLVAEGLMNKEIAAHLGVKEKTVKMHLSTIMGKLGVLNRQQVGVMIARAGFVEFADEPDNKGEEKR